MCQQSQLVSKIRFHLSLTLRLLLTYMNASAKMSRERVALFHFQSTIKCLYYGFKVGRKFRQNILYVSTGNYVSTLDLGSFCLTTATESIKGSSSLKEGQKTPVTSPIPLPDEP